MKKNLKEYFFVVKKEIDDDQVFAYAAQSAFFMILSFIPFLILFSSLLRFTPVTEGDVLNLINANTPDYLKSVLVFIVDEVYNNSMKSISFTAVVAVWSAAKGIQYLSGGLNQIYDLKETRNWLVLRIRAIIYTVVFALMIEVLMLLIVFAKRLKNLIVLNVPAMSNFFSVLIKFRMVIILLILISFFALSYKVLPNKRLSFRHQIIGSIICAVSWYVFSLGLSVYVNCFNGFSMYGSLITVVLIMFWLYICLVIYLVCGEINSVRIQKELDVFTRL